MNSLTKLGHQVNAEISGFQIGTKETVKALKTLQELNVRLEHGPILISDSQTVLSLCSRPSSTLDLSTSLVVSRVQEVFTTDRLYFAPGSTFSQSVNILTRYRPHLQTLISEEFYRPSWLLPEIADRVTVRVEHIRKQPEESLPHLCAQQQVRALMQGSKLVAN